MGVDLEATKGSPKVKEIRLVLKKPDADVQDGINTVVQFNDAIEKAKEAGWELTTLSIEDSYY